MISCGRLANSTHRRSPVVPDRGTPTLRTVAGLNEPKPCEVRGLGARRGFGLARAVPRRTEVAVMAVTHESTDMTHRVGLMAQCQRCSIGRKKGTGGGMSAFQVGEEPFLEKRSKLVLLARQPFVVFSSGLSR
jgi:hypothetical protein